MRFFLLALLAVLNFSMAFGQDIIVIRKTDEEIKCRIISVNDTILHYRLWQSPDTTIHEIKRYELLSFMIDKPSRKSKNIYSSVPAKNGDYDLLGEYQSGNLVSGYIITEKGDTVAGLIRINNVAMNQVEVRFTYPSGDSVKFNVNDLKAYGYMDLHYEKFATGYHGEITNGYTTTNGLLFLHRAVDGPSKLYRFYKLTFRNGVMKSYDNQPPYYFGKLKRQFIITNPAGEKVFTKGRTIKGSLNRIYYKYQGYFSQYPLKNPDAGDLPMIVNRFNRWFNNQK